MFYKPHPNLRIYQFKETLMNIMQTDTLRSKTKRKTISLDKKNYIHYRILQYNNKKKKLSFTIFEIMLLHKLTSVIE